MGADSGFRPSVPRLSVAPVCYDCKACDWEADRAVGGRFWWPWPTRRGSSQASATGPRKVADAIVASMTAQRRRNRERYGMRPIPVTAGAAATHARPPRARAAARVLRGAQRALLRAAGALLPTRLLATALPDRGSSRRACPAGVPGCGKRILVHAVWCHFIAGDGRRCLAWNIAVYVGVFCAAKRKVARRLSRVYAEAGYRAKQDVPKTALCIDRARSIHKLIPVPGPA
jgi:hypothetical protein